ncbi:MAG: winged helix DNA-binding domain-containing protein [Actinophytocola sp.]|uniref:winged helix DNA-binding domain-containing protein n=1 Tax=Actinophytocola sp. TaxID=1872138 RepID=UPI003D6BC7F9
MGRFSADDTCRLRAAAQGLAGSATTVVDAVRRVVGLQAQDVRACRLAVRVRTRGLTAADVDAACREKAVVRTWAMRGTLHMVAADDFGWVNGLFGPYFAARGAPRRRQLGLGDATLERAAAAFEEIAREPHTRSEIVERLADHGVRLEPKSQEAPHLLAYAANTGQLCRGPDTAKDEPTYVLVDEWLGPQKSLTEEEALARLAVRYLRGHGPATAEDLATWSGLPVTLARAAVETVEEEALADDPLPDAPTRLLGHFDAYLLGYRGRDLAVPAEHQREVQAGGGFVMPVVLNEGRAVGTWRATTRKNEVEVTATGFGGQSLPDLADEIADLNRFLDRASRETGAGNALG